jgi:hypothetical protein
VAYMDARRVMADERLELRDEVDFRAPAFGPDARALPLLIVNLSPHGLMARCEASLREGDRIRVTLPVIGAIAAEVRWSLGGRLGCRFDDGLDRASYYELLSAVLRR